MPRSPERMEALGRELMAGSAGSTRSRANVSFDQLKACDFGFPPESHSFSFAHRLRLPRLKVHAPEHFYGRSWKRAHETNQDFAVPSCQCSDDHKHRPN